MADKLDQIRVLLFDTFGTTADWRGSLTRELAAFGQAAGRSADWDALAVEWRSLYQPAVASVRDGERLWAGFEELHRETLDMLLPKYGLNTLSDVERDELVLLWRRLEGWPDAVEGLMKLKRDRIIGAFSNGTTRQLVEMARFAGFPWDVILAADQFQTYKPAPALYEGALRVLQAAPETVMLVAAHNNDLQAAAKQGMRTAFVYRPTEDSEPQGEYTCVARDFVDLAEQLAGSKEHPGDRVSF